MNDARSALLNLGHVAIEPPLCPEAERIVDEHLRELLVDGPLSYEIDRGRLTIGRGDIGLMLRTD